MAKQLPQDVLHDATVAVVVGLAGGVDAHYRVELGSVAGLDMHDVGDRVVEDVADAGGIDSLLTGTPSESALCPSGNCSGTPIPIRLERSIR